MFSLLLEILLFVSRTIRGSVSPFSHLYFQLKNVCRSVISRVIMRGRYESASTIGCFERNRMLINMMQVANLTKKAVHYCFAFNQQIAHMRIFCSEHFKNSLLLYCMGSLFDQKVKPQSECWNVELSLRKRDLDSVCVVNKHSALSVSAQKSVVAQCNGLQCFASGVQLLIVYSWKPLLYCKAKT